ncbi:MAG: 30S ribosomal protein S2 [Planctomycetota bacterium]
MAKELVRELINAGVHFGHGVSRWNPKMTPYIFVKRGNIHIIDVKKTLKGLLIAKKLLADVVSSGKDVVFVGTKRQSQKAVEEVAKKCNMHFVSHRWLGGMLTNFRTVRSRLQRLEQLEAMQQDGSLEKESKKQGSRLKREMRKIKANLDGVREMSRLPGAVVAVDAKKEYLALREARKLGVATIAVIDTDSDPDTVDVAIPANDDSIRAIALILNELCNAVAAGKTMMPARDQETAAPRMRRARSKRPALARAKADDKVAFAADEPPKVVEEATPQATDEPQETIKIPSVGPDSVPKPSQAQSPQEPASE